MLVDRWSRTFRHRRPFAHSEERLTTPKLSGNSNTRVLNSRYILEKAFAGRFSSIRSHLFALTSSLGVETQQTRVAPYVSQVVARLGRMVVKRDIAWLAYPVAEIRSALGTTNIGPGANDRSQLHSPSEF